MFGGVIMIPATATDIQNNFGHYLQAVQKLQDLFPTNQAFPSWLIHLLAFLKMIMMIKQFVQKG